MEAVARQFGRGDAHALIVRNGFFSFAGAQIFEAGGLRETTVMMAARRQRGGAPLCPAPIDEVVARIRRPPRCGFRPACRNRLRDDPADDYITALADAAHGVGRADGAGLHRLGAVWVDMRQTGVDVLISARKGLERLALGGMVILSALGSRGWPRPPATVRAGPEMARDHAGL